MAYTAVPTVATGDLWTAANHNAYIKDNFAAGVPDIFTTKGDLAVASGADAAGRLGVGSNGQLLTADSVEALGMKWALSPVLDLIQAKGDLLAGSAADTLARVAVGTNEYILVADSSQAAGVKWALHPIKDLIQAKGDVLAGSAADALVRVAVGTDGYLFVADSSQAGGVGWSAATMGTTFARYKVSSSKSIASATAVILDFDTADYDTDSAVTTGASWKYTVPSGKGGYYAVSAASLIEASTAWNVGEYAVLRLYKNGTQIANLDILYMMADAGTAYAVMLSGITMVELAAGDYIDVRLYQNSGSTLTVNAGGPSTHVAIARLF